MLYIQPVVLCTPDGKILREGKIGQLGLDQLLCACTEGDVWPWQERMGSPRLYYRVHGVRVEPGPTGRVLASVTFAYGEDDE